MKPLHLALVAATAAFALTACENTTSTGSASEDAQMSDNIEQQPIGSLIGKPVRTFVSGSPLTMDHNPERVNIETDEQGTIVRIWKG